MLAEFQSSVVIFPFSLTRDWSRVARELRESHPGPIYVCNGALASFRASGECWL